MKKSYLVAALLLVSSCQMKPVSPTRIQAENSEDAEYNVARSPAQETAPQKPKDYFKNVTKQVRDDVLARAEVFSSEYRPEMIPGQDFVADLQQFCGEPYGFSPAKYVDEHGNLLYLAYKWNDVQCDYHPDKEQKMGGGSPKFLCDFKDSSKKDGIVTRKVKYTPNDDFPLDEGYGSEVIETTLGFMISKLIGLHTNMYCPAHISCVGCPSEHPWKNNRASAGKSNKTIQKYAVVDRGIDAHIVSTPVKEGPRSAPNGFDYDEIAKVSAPNESESRRMLIEREAWVLWVHFIQSVDGGDFNNRVSCLEHEKAADGTYYCVKPIMYTHDFGHAFHYHMKFDKWSRIPALVANKAVGCSGGMNRENLGSTRNYFTRVKRPSHELFMNGGISAEARDLFVERLSRITNEQWAILWELARGPGVAKVKTEKWVSTINRKIAEMKAAPCQPFDSGKSMYAIKK